MDIVFFSFCFVLFTIFSFAFTFKVINRNHFYYYDSFDRSLITQSAEPDLYKLQVKIYFSSNENLIIKHTHKIKFKKIKNKMNRERSNRFQLFASIQ